MNGQKQIGTICFSKIFRIFIAPIFAIFCGLFCHIESAHAVDYPFSLTTSSISSGGTFEFYLSAQGTFYVDCGTGGTLSSTNSTANAMISGGTINKTDTTLYIFRCTYSSAGTKTIRFGGTATNYNTGTSTSVISFYYYRNANAALITSISGNLSTIFPYISGNAANGAQPRFYETFRRATNITSIPDTLFSGYTVASTYMFYYTFNGCTGLTSIPENLFSKITSGAQYMFGYTFYGCTGLTSIPENLFSKITSGAQYMFYYTFYQCTGLTSIPANLFSKITSGVQNMFNTTFKGCSNLTGFIPPTLFDGLIKNNAATNTFNNTFVDTGMLTSCPSGATQYASTYTRAWGGKVSCTCPDGYYYNNGICNPYPFSLTTSSISSGGTFQFSLSAQGTFYVDCGTGGTLSSDDSTANAMISGGTINKTNTTQYTFKCTYSSAGTKTIRFGGTATNYNTGTTTAAISFYTSAANTALITSISGNLSTIFPYISGNAQPRFYQTFSGANITSIPDTLFSGYTVASTGMFGGTFYNCSNLTGFIPPRLFDGLIKNNAATDTFADTFSNTGMLTSCPSGTTQYASTYTSAWGGKVSCLLPINLTFDGGSPMSCTMGSTFVPPTPAARPGYIFSGWRVKAVNP